MDPLSALAIAAAVIQFADIGVKLVNKAWNIYQQTDKEERREKEKNQLEQTSSELSFLIEGIDNASSSLPSPETASPAQSQLLRACSECHSVAAEFGHLLQRIQKQLEREAASADRSRSARASRSGRSGFRLWSATQADKDIKPDLVPEIQRRLRSLRETIMNSVILCLWEDSKRTKQWEVHFSKQLHAMAGLIGQIDETTRRLHLDRAINTEDIDFHTQHKQRTILLQQSLKDVTPGSHADMDALLPLAQASQTVSWQEIETDITGSINIDRRAGGSDGLTTMILELSRFIWDKEWKLDATMAAPMTLDYSKTARAICRGLRFDTIQSRECAITKTFEETYSWIFQEEPRKQDNQPMWHSFPRWLAETNDTSLYWITGKPGSGKSTMIKFLLQSPALEAMLSRWARPLPLLVVKYYAWRAGSSLQKSFEGLKRTIISQALELRPELSPIVTPRRWAFFQIMRGIGVPGGWTAWEIDECFEALLSECGRSFKLAIFLDGLDEFGSSAKQVIDLVRDIQERGGQGVKACVASRPWSEFDDAYGDSPLLEIHKFTRGDMIAFVTGKFRGHKGFNEQRCLYPEATDKLLTDIVEKADGVFLWVAFVVDHLSALLTSGRSIADVKQVLTTLPPHLSELYDTIWASVQAEERPNGSWMMQVLKAVDSPVPWFTMWLIEECRVAPFDTNAAPKAAEWKVEASKSLKRKLSARTKGILEVSWSEDGRAGHVTFIHRTARDWVEQPEVWQRICASTPEGFDPFMALLEAETLGLSDLDLAAQDYTTAWRAITRTLCYASEASDKPENAEGIVRLLDTFDAVLQQTYQRALKDIPEVAHKTFRAHLQHVPPNTHWSSTQWREGAMPATFIGLVARFSILPYIKAKMLHDKFLFCRQPPQDHILRNAIYGISFSKPHGIQEAMQVMKYEIPPSRRLATVQFLLDQGVREARGLHAEGLSQMRSEIRSRREWLARGLADPEYADKVLELLERKDPKLLLKSLAFRIRCLQA